MNRRGLFGFLGALFAAPLAALLPKRLPPKQNLLVSRGVQVVYRDTDSVVYAYDIKSSFPFNERLIDEMINPTLPGGINRLYGNLTITPEIRRRWMKERLNALYGKFQGREA
jgi:hypothetical protein